MVKLGRRNLDYDKWCALPSGMTKADRAYRMKCDYKVLLKHEAEWATLKMGVYTREYGVVIPKETSDDIHSI